MSLAIFANCSTLPWLLCEDEGLGQLDMSFSVLGVVVVLADRPGIAVAWAA